MAESTSWESRASHACGLGSEASGSTGEGEGEGDGDGDGDGVVGEDGAEDAGLDRAEGGGVAGGPMAAPASRTSAGRLPDGDDGPDEDAAAWALGITPGMMVLARRSRKVLPDRVVEDVVVEVDVDADAVAPPVDDTARPEAVAEAEAPLEAAARLRDACGDTVDSCS